MLKNKTHEARIEELERVVEILSKEAHRHPPEPTEAEIIRHGKIAMEAIKRNGADIARWIESLPKPPEKRSWWKFN